MLEGDWPVPLGIPLHLELHRPRPDVGWAVHSHPRFGTRVGRPGRVPADARPELGLGGGGLVLVDEYDGG